MVVQLAVGAVVLIVGLAIVSSLFGGTGTSTNLSSRSATTFRSTSLATTTTKPPPPLPAGDDRTVKTVLDGDSFEIQDGTKIRLIGIDAPDVETSDCFSAEATSHLKELLPAEKSVRLVYDTTKTDRFGRTLAYVYRPTDGLLVNVAMVRDGFAIPVTGGSNTAHADEIATAATEAKDAKRGLWQSCQTSTTASRPATTAAPDATTTTEPPATTTTTAAPSTTSTSPGLVVEPGGLCLAPGSTGVFSTGAPAVCAAGTDGIPRWRAA